MKVIIIEEDNSKHNAKASESEMLYNQLKKKGIDVHVIPSKGDFIARPLSKKQKKKYFIND